MMLFILFLIIFFIVLSGIFVIVLTRAIRSSEQEEAYPKGDANKNSDPEHGDHWSSSKDSYQQSSEPEDEDLV